MANNRTFNPFYDTLILTIIDSFRAGDARNPSTDAILMRYSTDSLQHNIRCIRNKLEESDLMKRIFYEQYKYIREVHELFPFYCNNGFFLPENFEQRTNTLIQELNSFKLGNVQDTRNLYEASSSRIEYKLSFYVCNPLPEDEIQQFTRENAEQIIGILSTNFRGMLKIKWLKKKFPKRFEQAYEHLEARAVKADSFIENLTRTYERLDRVIKKENRRKK